MLATAGVDTDDEARQLLFADSPRLQRGKSPTTHFFRKTLKDRVYFLHELILIPCFSCSHRGQEKGVMHALSPLYFSFQRMAVTVQESMEEIH